MEEWFSGTIPYRWLGLSQILIIFVYAKVCLDFTFGRGLFVIPRRSLGTGLLKFGSAYLGVMVMRYVIRMSLYPHERWTGGSIPIFFHWVLASFLLLVGYYHWERTRGEPLRQVHCATARASPNQPKQAQISPNKAYRPTPAAVKAISPMILNSKM